ncbi:MAG: PepSY domain-containing protein [Bifidobacteriaceae bacterium]|nr:PepSY domain-containing protein [Bifidobacteriaceae bacterium]
MTHQDNPPPLVPPAGAASQHRVVRNVVIAVTGAAMLIAAGALAANALKSTDQSTGPVVGQPVQVPVRPVASDGATDQAEVPTDPTAGAAAALPANPTDPTNPIDPSAWASAPTGGDTSASDTERRPDPSTAPTPAVSAAPAPATPTVGALPAPGHHGISPDQLISEEQAKRIALAKVPGATSIRLHLDYEHGRPSYEGEIIEGAIEYEFEIDAITGGILEWEADHLYDDYPVRPPLGSG